MATVRSGESAKYGAKLFAYFFVVVLVGGGILGLGLVLAVPQVEVLAGWETGVVDETELAAGGVLAFLGAAVLLSGLFGLCYKLVADAVATGLARDQQVPGETAPTEDEESAGTRPAADSQSAPTASPREEPAEADTPAESRPESETSADEWTETPSPEADSGQGSGSSGGESNPREPSPEEIAFGSSSDDAETDRDDSGGVTPAGSSSSGDPLADPTDDE